MTFVRMVISSFYRLRKSLSMSTPERRGATPSLSGSPFPTTEVQEVLHSFSKYSTSVHIWKE